MVDADESAGAAVVVEPGEWAGAAAWVGLADAVGVVVADEWAGLVAWVDSADAVGVVVADEWVGLVAWMEQVAVVGLDEWATAVFPTGHDWGCGGRDCGCCA